LFMLQIITQLYQKQTPTIGNHPFVEPAGLKQYKEF